MSFDRLVERARAKVPGPEVNQALWVLRGELEATYGSAVLYELVVAEDTRWEDWLPMFLRRFSEHLQSKGMPPFGAPNVMVALWRSSSMYLFECTELFDAVAEIECIDRGELSIRIGDEREKTGLAREPYARRRGALLLGPSSSSAGPDDA